VAMVDDLDKRTAGYFSDDEDDAQATDQELGGIQDSLVKKQLSDDENPETSKRALCWSILAMAMSIPALIGA